MKTSLDTGGSLDPLRAEIGALPPAINLLLETMKEGVGLLDRNNILTYANSSLAGILGVQSSGIIGASAADFLNASNREIFESQRESAASGTPCSCEIAWARPDNSEVYTLMSLNCGNSRIGSADTCLMVLTDITMQKQVEMHLLQAQKMDIIGALSGSFAHDFNNMLSIISGNISVLANDIKDSDILVQLRDAEQALAQARKLTQQLLTFTRGGSPSVNPHDLNELLRATVSFVLRGARTRCQLSLAETLPAVEVDAGQVSQAIASILINAEQEMPDGGTVNVTSSTVDIGEDNELALSPGKYVRIIIKDHGKGIPGENISKVFDPFFTTKPKGSGLGLTTSYSIIRKHKGAITVHSEPGQGAEFDVYLPASEKSKSVIEQGKPRPHHGRALLMDDNEQMIQMLQRIIKRMGYDTVSTRNGSEAIEAYRKAMEENHQFDFVLFDISVPGGIGGAEAFREILALDPFAKGIVASGYANDPIMANYRDYGFSSVVAKPFFLKELTDAVEAALSAKPSP